MCNKELKQSQLSYNQLLKCMCYPKHNFITSKRTKTLIRWIRYISSFYIIRGINWNYNKSNNEFYAVITIGEFSDSIFPLISIGLYEREKIMICSTGKSLDDVFVYDFPRNKIGTQSMITQINEWLLKYGKKDLAK